MGSLVASKSSPQLRYEAGSSRSRYLAGGGAGRIPLEELQDRVRERLDAKLDAERALKYRS